MIVPELTARANEPKPRRRWFQFSVRTFLIVVTVFCVWLGMHANRTRKQKAAVAIIENHGGTVEYDYRFPEILSRNRRANNSTIPAWLIDFFGVDFFHNVWLVNSHFDSERNRLTASELIPALKELPELRLISLTNDSASDELLETIGKLKHMKELGLYGTNQVTDRGIVNLEQCSSLEGIYISSKAVTDETAGTLSKLPKLTSIVLYGDQYTDKAMFYLKECTALQEITIRAGDRKSGITDVGLGYMEQMKNLKTLTVPNMQTSPGNEGAARLRKSIPNLILAQ